MQAQNRAHFAHPALLDACLSRQTERHEARFALPIVDEKHS